LASSIVNTLGSQPAFAQRSYHTLRRFCCRTSFSEYSPSFCFLLWKNVWIIGRPVPYSIPTYPLFNKSECCCCSVPSLVILVDSDRSEDISNKALSRPAFIPKLLEHFTFHRDINSLANKCVSISLKPSGMCNFFSSTALLVVYGLKCATQKSFGLSIPQSMIFFSSSVFTLYGYSISTWKTSSVNKNDSSFSLCKSKSANMSLYIMTLLLSLFFNARSRTILVTRFHSSAFPDIREGTCCSYDVNSPSFGRLRPVRVVMPIGNVS